jgi:hypothetical protein
MDYFPPDLTGFRVEPAEALARTSSLQIFKAGAANTSGIGISNTFRLKRWSREHATSMRASSRSFPTRFGLYPDIAKHSPERILERELPIEAPEKNHGKETTLLCRQFSPVQFACRVSRKRGLFRVFHGQGGKISLQLRLHGGGRSHVRTLLRRNSLLTGKNTGKFRIRPKQ